MSTINANDLKIKGISAIEVELANQNEALISVRGKERFVVMDIAHYHYLRECELEAAVAQTRVDLTSGNYKKQSAEDHVTQLLKDIAAENPALYALKRTAAQTKKLKAVTKTKTVAASPVRKPRAAR